MDTAGNINYIYMLKNCTSFLYYLILYTKHVFFSYIVITCITNLPNFEAIDLLDEKLYTALGGMYDRESSFLSPKNSVPN